jgi:hypothetical protein
MNAFSWHTRSFVMGFACALGLAPAFGAGTVGQRDREPITPRYSVQYAGILLQITDNRTNTLYIYENTGNESVLRSKVDLNDTGKRILKGVPVNP